ncbi:hypothetical protein Acr_18g0010440 [Actinidia rufa]|uniref:Uncharacterized protein n=1 Tax=Actinidia rufa TaxID=165716 RepID=A0A7J0G7U3_9ERIC|nr:hypothetical protein Acr_18g0010440 [Actinidia rufa]
MYLFKVKFHTPLLPLTVDIYNWAWGLSEGTLPCKSPSFPCHPLGLSPVVAPYQSFQSSYYFELTKKRRLEDNDGLSSGRHSFVVVISPSSGTEGLRARSVAIFGRDLYPSKANVEWCSHRAPAQETTELAL